MKERLDAIGNLCAGTKLTGPPHLRSVHFQNLVKKVGPKRVSKDLSKGSFKLILIRGSSKRY